MTLSTAANTARNRLGFTLVELVMVLIILAILATAALNMVEVQVDQTRFETTQQTLNNVEAALIGSSSARAVDGTRVVSGFVADVGRLPLTIDELLIKPSNVPPYAVFRSDGEPTIVGTEVPSDQDVTAYGGWNGPYLQLPVGADKLTDGWNYSFDVFTEDGNVASGNRLVGIIRSNGRDGVVNGATAYDEDLLLVISANAGAITNGIVTTQEDRARGTFVANIFDGNVSMHPSANRIVLRVYGPVQTDPTNNPDIVAIETVYHDIYGDDLDEALDGVTSVSFSADLFAGPRVIKAYEIDVTFSPNRDDDLSAGGVNNARILRRSAAVPITISNETVPVNLILN